MPTTYHVFIGGTDFGPSGLDRVIDMDVDVVGRGKVGPGTITLQYPETESYTFVTGDRIEVYKLFSGDAFGYMGGVILNRRYTQAKIPNPTQVTVVLEVSDLNIALDAVTIPPTAAGAAPFTVPAGTLASQVTYLVHNAQFNGHAGVAWEINTVDYVGNLTGATVLPAFTMSDELLRDGMDKIMASAYAADTDLNPGYHVALMSDGLGGVEAAVLVYDKADVASPIYTIATDPDYGAGEYGIVELENLYTGASLIQRQFARWIQETFETTIEYTNDTSQAAYPNPFRNDDGPGGTGYWPRLSYEDSDSTTLAEAERKLERKVKPLEYPIQIPTVVVDNINARPGQVARLRIPEQDIDSAFTIAQVKVKFLPVAGGGMSYSQHTITLGRRKRGLFDEGDEGEAEPPDEVGPGIPPRPVITGITGGVNEGGGAYAVVTFTHGGMGGGGRLYYQEYPAGEVLSQDIPNRPSPVDVTVTGLTLDQMYAFWVVVYSGGGIPSRESEVEFYETETGIPATPEITGITSALAKDGYYATVAFTFAGEIEGGDLTYERTVGGQTYIQPFPAMDSPGNVVVRGLAGGVSYDFSLVVRDLNHQPSLPSTPVFPHTPGPQPMKDPPTPSWDEIHPDSDIPGYTQVSPLANTSVSISSAVTIGGRASLLMQAD